MVQTAKSRDGYQGISWPWIAAYISFNPETEGVWFQIIGRSKSEYGAVRICSEEINNLFRQRHLLKESDLFFEVNIFYVESEGK